MGQHESPTDGSARSRLPNGQYEVVASPWRVCDMPVGLRPREEVERVGVEHAAPDVLLAILLRTGTRGLNVVDLARSILQRFGSLTAVASAPVEELAGLPGVGPVKAQILKVALELGRRLTAEQVPRDVPVRTPADVATLMRETVRPLEQEVFWVLLLDAKNRLKSKPQVISHGLLDASLVHPREVFQVAIRANAAAMILVHNHPSGDPTPSAEDVRVTRQLVGAGGVVDIKILDHIVIGKGAGHSADGFVSMRESGLVDFA